jgi:hypothetical protein
VDIGLGVGPKMIHERSRTTRQESMMVRSGSLLTRSGSMLTRPESIRIRVRSRMVREQSTAQKTLTPQIQIRNTTKIMSKERMSTTIPEGVTLIVESEKTCITVLSMLVGYFNA